MASGDARHARAGADTPSSETYVNREPVNSAVLANGDDIQIGKFRLVFLTTPTTG